ncbi:MAG: hypothetical protein JXA28_01025 [Bacteroidetes bacterium]|nr:hypothetical protein [Bacteroidota bacterium]
MFEKVMQNPVGLFPFDVTVGTDSAEIRFSAEYASFVEVKGVRYLHGSTFPDLEYYAIPFDTIRYLALDWPIKVIRLDGTSVLGRSCTKTARCQLSRLRYRSLSRRSTASRAGMNIRLSEEWALADVEGETY